MLTRFMCICLILYSSWRVSETKIFLKIEHLCVELTLWVCNDESYIGTNDWTVNVNFFSIKSE